MANCTTMNVLEIQLNRFDTTISNDSVSIKTAVPLVTYDPTSSLCSTPVHSEFICYKPSEGETPRGPTIKMDYISFAIYSFMIFLYLLFAGYISSFCANKEFHRRNYWVVIITLLLQTTAFLIQAITAFRQSFHDHTGFQISYLESMTKSVQITISYQTHTIILFAVALEWYLCYKHLKTSKITMEWNTLIIQDSYNIEDDETPTVDLAINFKERVKEHERQQSILLQSKDSDDTTITPRSLKFSNLNRSNVTPPSTSDDKSKKTFRGRNRHMRRILPSRSESHPSSQRNLNHTISQTQTHVHQSEDTQEEEQKQNLLDPRESSTQQTVIAKDDAPGDQLKTKPQTYKTTVFNTQNNAASTGVTCALLIVGLIIATLGVEFSSPTLAIKLHTFITIIVWLVILSIIACFAFAQSMAHIDKLQNQIDTFNLTFPVISKRLKRMAQVSIAIYLFQNILIICSIVLQRMGARDLNDHKDSQPNLLYLRVGACLEMTQKLLLLVPTLAITRIMSDITVFKYFVSKMDRRQAKKLRNKKRRFRKYLKSKRLKKYNAIISKLHGQTRSKHEQWKKLVYNNYKNKVEAMQAIKESQQKKEREKEKRNLIINNQFYDIDRSDDEDSQFEYVDDE